MEQSEYDVLVIGSGAAGLMAASRLLRAGKTVSVLEARDRVGGRTFTFKGDGFNFPVELGAEFIHGRLPVTLSLLDEAGIAYRTAVGEMWRYHDGMFIKPEQFLINYELIIKKLNELKTDITLNEFLAFHFADPQYKETCEMLRNFAAGYDTADPNLFSAFALRNELQSEDDNHQYRIEVGYGNLIGYLENDVIKLGGIIKLQQVVKDVQWQAGLVTVVTDEGVRFAGKKVIIALPLGVLQADKDAKAALAFNPDIPNRKIALKQMGMGSVIKILLQFDDKFWEKNAIKKGAGAEIEKMSYLFSQEAIPTWWTQQPDDLPLLTGWIGGPAAFNLKNTSNAQILEMALSSISNIYDITLNKLKRKLTACKIMNWPADTFTLGSYSYATVYTSASRELLMQPEANTIYFTGEYMYKGPEMGTVEAALASGKEVAAQILSGR